MKTIFTPKYLLTLKKVQINKTPDFRSPLHHLSLPYLKSTQETKGIAIKIKFQHFQHTGLDREKSLKKGLS